MPDRLERIRAELPLTQATPVGDTRWLIAEVDRLRGEVDELLAELDGRNVLAHALVALQRAGWLRAKPLLAPVDRTVLEEWDAQHPEHVGDAEYRHLLIEITNDGAEEAGR